mgnify:CR=1 FL=1
MTNELNERFSPMHVKQAIGIASDKRYAGGNMTGAVKAIEKMKKGFDFVFKGERIIMVEFFEGRFEVRCELKV